MDFLFSSIPEELIVQHHVFPSNGFIQLEFDLVDLMPRLHVDEEVSMIKDGIYQQVRAVFDIIDSSSWGFNE